MKPKGYITVYFSLILLLVLSVVCATVESAHYAGLQVKCRSTAFLALESVFADYSIPLLKDYGLLFLDKNYGTDQTMAFMNHLKEYMEYHIDPNKDLLIKGSDLFPLSLEEIKVTNQLSAVDYGGGILEKEILSYMGYEIPADIVEWILDQLNILEQAKTVTKVFERLSEIEKQADGVDKAVQRMYEHLETIKRYKNSIEERIDTIEEALEELEEVYDKYRETEDEELENKYERRIKSIKDNIERKVKTLIKEQNNLLKYTDYALKDKESYLSNTRKVMQKLEKTKDEMEIDWNDLGEELKDSLTSELEEIQKYSGGVGDVYRVEQTAELLENNKTILEENINRLKEYSSGKINGLEQALEDVRRSLTKYNKENLKLNFDNTPVKRTGVLIVEQIKEIMKNGILGYVMDGEISEQALKMDQIPSKENYDNRRLSNDGILDDISRRVIVDEYILKKFQNALSQEGKQLWYEMEYILAGKEKDSDNLLAVVQQLLLMREGMNLIYLMGDQEKKEEAKLLATALVGFTGMYGLIKVTQLIILAAWAFSEALYDVHSLLEGNKVAIFKQKNTWRISFDMLMNFQKEDLRYHNKKQEGLEYNDYLRILLYLEPSEKKLYRMMDIIQYNTQAETNNYFLMENCISAMEIETSFFSKPVFMALPFFNQTQQNGAYYFSGKVSYSYQ